MNRTYIELELNGKKYGWKFNNYAWHIFVEKARNHSYLAAAPYAMIWAGICANAYVKNVELDCTFEEVCDWVDVLADEKPEQIIALDAIFTESTQFKKMVDAARTVMTGDEKKSTSTNALNSLSDG